MNRSPKDPVGSQNGSLGFHSVSGFLGKVCQSFQPFPNFIDRSTVWSDIGSLNSLKCVLLHNKLLSNQVLDWELILYQLLQHGAADEEKSSDQVVHIQLLIFLSFYPLIFPGQTFWISKTDPCFLEFLEEWGTKCKANFRTSIRPKDIFFSLICSGQVGLASCQIFRTHFLNILNCTLFIKTKFVVSNLFWSGWTRFLSSFLYLRRCLG